MRFTLYLALLLATLAPPARAATISFSDIPSTNVVNASDLLLLDSHLGGTNYATRTITVSSLPPGGNWTYPNSTNATLAGVATMGTAYIDNALFPTPDGFFTSLQLESPDTTNWTITASLRALTNTPNYFAGGFTDTNGTFSFNQNLTTTYLSFPPTNVIRVDNGDFSVSGNATIAGVASAGAVVVNGNGVVTPTNTDFPAAFWMNLHDTSGNGFVMTIDSSTNFGYVSVLSDGHIQMATATAPDDSAGIFYDLYDDYFEWSTADTSLARLYTTGEMVLGSSGIGPWGSNKLGINTNATATLEVTSYTPNVDYQKWTDSDGTLAARVTSNKVLYASSGFLSGAPSGGTAAAWKLGSLKTCSAVTIVVTNYIELEVGGVTNAIPILRITP